MTGTETMFGVAVVSAFATGYFAAWYRWRP